MYHLTPAALEQPAAIEIATSSGACQAMTPAKPAAPVEINKNRGTLAANLDIKSVSSVFFGGPTSANCP